MLAPCGTEAAYRRHLRYGEEPDEDCKRASNAAVAARVARKRPPKDEHGYYGGWVRRGLVLVPASPVDVEDEVA